jgi:hypothetical protein
MHPSISVSFSSFLISLYLFFFLSLSNSIFLFVTRVSAAAAPSLHLSTQVHDGALNRIKGTDFMEFKDHRSETPPQVFDGNTSLSTSSMNTVSLMRNQESTNIFYLNFCYQMLENGRHVMANFAFALTLSLCLYVPSFYDIFCPASVLCAARFARSVWRARAGANMPSNCTA